MTDLDSTVEFQYKSAPITEAVIGVTFSSAMSSEELGSAAGRLQALYPHKQDISAYSIAVKINEKNPGENKTELNPTSGFRLSSDDQTQLVVLWPNSFTISQLAPYSGWGNFISRFERDWRQLKRLFGFQEINRIGVRYINRIDIPASDPILQYDDYLNIYPKIPSLFEPLDAYAVQASTQMKDIDCQATINSAIVPSPLLKHVSFIVDIDIGTIKTPPQNDERIMGLLTEIRARKNAIFESCINQPARNLFK